MEFEDGTKIGNQCETGNSPLTLRYLEYLSVHIKRCYQYEATESFFTYLHMVKPEPNLIYDQGCKMNLNFLEQFFFCLILSYFGSFKITLTG